MLLLELASTILATPLLLNLPTLLDPALLIPIAPAITNTTSPDEISCFNPGPKRIPTNYHDCALAASEIATGSDTRIYTFGRRRSSGVNYKLPKTFESGTCTMTLDMIYDDQQDMLTLAMIKDTALRLALRCSTGPVFNVGGIEAVGPKGVLYITMIGTNSRPVE